MGPDLPSISVVVIGRNEGRRLVRCLESVRAADYPAERLELIYVDTDSADSSCAVGERLGAKVICIKPERPCAAAARNAGLQAARHALLQFLDGDTILNPSWLQRALPALEDSRVACVFGRVEEVDPTASVYNFWAHHDWHVPPGNVDACGGVALFRRDVLLRAGGYDSSLIVGEERDLCYRLIRDQNVAMMCVDEPMALHDMNMRRFGQYWRRCVRTGHGYAEVAHRHGNLRGRSRAHWREPCHVLAAVAAIGLSVGLRSAWPAMIWVGLIMLAVLRNGLRVRSRVGTLHGALLYAAHHYLAKLPITIGQCAYWIRVALRRPPRPLIEHR